MTIMRPLGAITTGIVAYVVAAILVYWLFYSNHPYNDETGAGVTAFKTGFLVSYIVHVGLTITSSVPLARLWKVPILPVAIGVAAAVALLALPTLGFLSSLNDCIGITFPLEGSCITREGNT